MAGYVRQSAATIQDGEDVIAGPLNAEFNQLQSAFDAATGHNHQGGAGNGPKLSLTAAVSGILPPANGGTGAALTTVDNTIPRFNGTGGTLQTSGVTIDDSNNINTVGTLKTGAGTDVSVIANPSIYATNAGSTNIVVRNSTSDVEATLGVGSAGSIGTVTNHDFNIFSNNANRITITAAGVVTIPSGVFTGTFSGTGTALTALNATNLTSGTVDPERVLTGDGIAVRISATAWANRTITGSGGITVTNGNGVAGNINIAAPAALPSFPAGTVMLFAQTTAPVGWTKLVTHNNKALRVVSGTASSGGTVAFDTAFASKAVTGSISSTTATGDVGATALTAAMLPAHAHTFSDSGTTGFESANHTHTFSGTTSSSGSHAHNLLVRSRTIESGTSATLNEVHPVGLSTAGMVVAGGAHTHSVSGTTSAVSANHTHNFSVSGTTSSVGSGSTHDHTFTGVAHTHTFTGTAINIDVQYVDVILADKD